MLSNCGDRVSMSVSLGNGDFISCTYAHRLEQVLCLLIHVQHPTLAVLCEVERRHLGHVLILPLTLLFLQLEGDAAHRSALDTLHQVGGVAGDLKSIFISWILV